MQLSFAKKARIVVSLLAVALFALVVCVTAATLLASFSPLFFEDSSHAKKISWIYTGRVLVFTLMQAFCSLAIALVVGITAAFFVAKRSFWGRRFLISLSSIPLCLPPLILALGYVTFFGISGLANRVLSFVISGNEAPLTFLYSFWGIIIAQGFYNFPLIMASVSEVWRCLNSNQADSARLLGAGERKIFMTVTIFQLVPSIVSGAIPVFLYCFFSFMIVLLFGSVGGTTLEVQIYHAVRSSLDFKGAALLALTETFVAALILTLYSYMEKKSKSMRDSLLAEPHQLKKLGEGGTKEKIVFVLFALTVLVFFIAPLSGIFYNACSFVSRGEARLSFTLLNFVKIFSSSQFFSSLKGTLATGFLTAIFSSVMGFIYAVFLRIRERKSDSLILRVIPILPMAISSVVMGFGIMILFRQGNFFHLVIAQTALIWPFAFRQIYAQLSKVSFDVMDAARILSKSRLDSLFMIYLPYGMRGILSSLAFCFAASAGDATLPLVLSLKNFFTLSLFTYRLAGRYKFHEACAAGIMLAFLCAVFFLISHALRNEKFHFKEKFMRTGRKNHDENIGGDAK